MLIAVFTFRLHSKKFIEFIQFYVTIVFYLVFFSQNIFNGLISGVFGPWIKCKLNDWLEYKQLMNNKSF